MPPFIGGRGVAEGARGGGAGPDAPADVFGEAGGPTGRVWLTELQ